MRVTDRVKKQKKISGLPYLCPACGGTGKVDNKNCKVCKGLGRVDLNVINAIQRKPKRMEQRNILRGQY